MQDLEADSLPGFPDPNWLLFKNQAAMPKLSGFIISGIHMS
jgi:hypothetical protein